MNKKYYLIALVLLVLSSCSKFRKIEKSDDLELKYKAANDYFEKEDYYRSSVLLEQILPLLRGDERAEKAQYLYAYTHYHQKLYVQSAYYFKTFYDTYSRSELAEEARYMHAYSLYLDSPIYNLDQTSTEEAIKAMQAFLDKYPLSKFKESGNEIINGLQVKLEDKAYNNAKEYYKLKDYDPRNLKSAIIAFDNFEKDFPDSKRNDEINFLKIEASFNLAKQSIYSKQKERYQDTLTLYESYIDRYPESTFLKEAESIYKKSVNALSKINKNS